jgi:hypothetical protein
MVRTLQQIATETEDRLPATKTTANASQNNAAFL